MCQMASRAQGRAHVATPHVKRLGPPKSRSHRTEVQILVPTPHPSLRGHNWSTALLAARVRLRNKRRLRFTASRRWLFRPLDSIVDKQREKSSPQGQDLLTLPDRLCEVGSNEVGPGRNKGNQRRQFELARQQRASQSPSSLHRRHNCFRREIVQRKGDLFRRSGLEEGFALKALGAARRLRLPPQLSRLAESLDGRRCQYPHLGLQSPLVE